MPVAPIQSVDRALLLLRAVAEADDPPSAKHLAAVAGVNRSTAWRLLATLEAHGLIWRDPTSGTYQLAFGLVRLAALAPPPATARRVRSTLQWLVRETGESSQLTIHDAGALRVIDEVVGPNVVSARWVGRSLPLLTSSVGKLLLANLPDDEAETLITRSGAERDPQARVDPDRLRSAVAEARRTGIGSSLGEYEPDVHGFSSAVLDRGTPIAFLSVSAPASRLPETRLPEIAPLLLQAAARASKQLGIAN